MNILKAFLITVISLIMLVLIFAIIWGALLGIDIFMSMKKEKKEKPGEDLLTYNTEVIYWKETKRPYDWSKHNPVPDVYEFKMGSYPYKKDEHKYTTFRIEKEFVTKAAYIWGYPVRLAIPLSVLDKQQTAAQYIQHYERAKWYDYQTLVVNLYSAHHKKDMPRDKNNWQSLAGSVWYDLEWKRQHKEQTCTARWDAVHRYHYCNLSYTSVMTDPAKIDKDFSDPRYYWTSDAANVDPFMQMPIIFSCGSHGSPCSFMITYNHNTDLIVKELRLNAPLTTPMGKQKNPFLYADYMPKIIQFLKEREVNEDAIHSSAN